MHTHITHRLVCDVILPIITHCRRDNHMLLTTCSQHKFMQYVRQAPKGPLHFIHSDSILKPYVWESQKYIQLFTGKQLAPSEVFSIPVYSLPLAKITYAHG